MFSNLLSNLTQSCYKASGRETTTDEEATETETETEESNVFRLPIYYNKQQCRVSEEIITELELEQVYQVMCPVNNPHERAVLKEMAETYTTDVKYLQDTQSLLTKYKQAPPVEPILHVVNLGKPDDDANAEQEDGGGSGGKPCRMEIWRDPYYTVVELEKELQNDQLFSKYGLIDYEHFEFLNNLDHVLQLMTLYVIVSPLLTLATPIILFILPFLILQLRYSELTWEVYVTILKDIGKSNPLIRMLTHYGEATTEQKTYQVLTFSFYLFSIYQQLSYCYRFYENFLNLHRYLIHLRTYLERTIQQMRHVISFTHELKTYKQFNTDLCRNINQLMDIIHLLSPVTPFSWSFAKLCQMGYVLKTFYTVKTNPVIMQHVTYAFHFNAYFRHLETLAALHTSGKIHCAKLLKDKSPSLKLKHMYYPALIRDDHVVQNHVSLDKNLILTGPNASGKTTTIKAIFLNVLLTQQFGMGCYAHASLTPFKHLHCYLNIPDTMGRDSLFQAEARRCKKMIDAIATHPEGKHLCMFDELFSGTNPEEAVASSDRFIRYITKQNNVKWVLTTHYHKLCKSLDKHPAIQNCHMDVSQDFVPSYKVKRNISKMQGAFKILSDMNFPTEITN